MPVPTVPYELPRISVGLTINELRVRPTQPAKYLCDAIKILLVRYRIAHKIHHCAFLNRSVHLIDFEDIEACAVL